MCEQAARQLGEEMNSKQAEGGKVLREIGDMRNWQHVRHVYVRLCCQSTLPGAKLTFSSGQALIAAAFILISSASNASVPRAPQCLDGLKTSRAGHRQRVDS